MTFRNVNLTTFSILCILSTSCKEEATGHTIVHKSSKVIDNEIEIVNDTIVSPPFIINGISSKWIKIVKINKSADFIELQSRNLVNIKTNTTILKGNEDILRKNNLDNIEIKDMDFDGLDDICIFNNGYSGNGSEFIDTYLFNKDKQIFDYSIPFSGISVTYNIEKRRVGNQGNVGANQQLFYFHNLAKNSLKVEFQESVFSDGVKLIYKKIVEGKAVQTKVISGKELSQILANIDETGNVEFLLERE